MNLLEHLGGCYFWPPEYVRFSWHHLYQYPLNRWSDDVSSENINMAVGQNPGNPVNIPKAFKIDYLGGVIIPKKVP